VSSFAAGGVRVASLAVVMWSMMRELAGENSGFVSYTQRWEMNDSAFMLILWPVQWLGVASAQLVARAIVALMVISWLTLTLPLYYLRPLFVEWDAVAVFDQGIVWLEFGPVWVLLVAWWWGHRRLPVRASDA